MDGKNETSQQMHRSKESHVAANKLKDIPEALQEVKNHLGDGAAENIMERTQIAEKKKEKQSNNVNRASRKRKSENNNKLAVEKEETTLETGNQLIPTPLSHIPLKTLTDIEMELVYTDEEEISFEFAEPVASTSTQSACRDSEKADALGPPNNSVLPYIDEELQKTLREARTSYRQENYEAAVEQFSTALELFSKGAAIDDTFESSPEDISSIGSFIETKLVTCYLKLRKLDDALNHSHRSIILNPAYFRNHLRQAAAFRCLGRYSEAARSTMIADYMYWLTGGTEQHTSKLIKQYWQAMIEEAIAREVSFSVMYTPFVTEVKADKINKIKDLFAKKHPDYVEHIYTDLPCIVVTARPKFIPISVAIHRSPMVIPAAEPSLSKNILPSVSTDGLITTFESISAAGMGIDSQVSFSLLKTDPHGFHFLPQTAEWPSLPPQRYLLTLGFRNKHIGKILERWSSKKLPIFSDRKAPFNPLTTEETKRYWDNTGKKIVPVMDFIRSTKLTPVQYTVGPRITYLEAYVNGSISVPPYVTARTKDNRCACSRGIEKLHYASFLGRLQRVEEQSQVINQAMAELATIPYLQDISQQDAELLQSLMADAMDTLEGRSDKGRVWNKIQKIGLIEDYLYQVEDNYLKNKRLRTARREKMKRTQSTQQL